jgi:pimeloyl-ACP methyl ester carboxylesterase
MPTLVLFGTLDAVIPPEMGDFYKELIANSHHIFVYDAGRGRPPLKFECINRARLAHSAQRVAAQ